MHTKGHEKGESPSPRPPRWASPTPANGGLSWRTLRRETTLLTWNLTPYPSPAAIKRELTQLSLQSSRLTTSNTLLSPHGALP